jgi:hypothetical protein
MGAVSKGKLSISRTTSNLREKDFVTMTIHDDNGVGVVTVELSLENFAEALTGVMRTQVDKIEVYDNFNKIGKKLETKKENLKYIVGEPFDFVMVSRALPYEKDGWVAQIPNFNHRNYNYTAETYPITFKRYV